MKLAALLAITTTLACNVQTDADTKFAIRKKTADKSGAAQEKTTFLSLLAMSGCLLAY